MRTIKDNVQCKAASAYAPGDLTITVDDVASLPSSYPYSLSAFNTSKALLTKLKISGRTGNVLDVDGTYDGYADSAIPVNASLVLAFEAGVIQEVQAEIMTQGDALTTLAGDVATLSTLPGQVTTLASTVTTQGNTLTTLSGHVTTLAGTVTSQGNTLTTLSGQVSTLSTQVAGKASQTDLLAVQSSVLGKADIGTVTAIDARLTTAEGEIDALQAASSTYLTSSSNLNASNLTSGTVATARLGTGTASSTTYLRGDGTWSSTGAFVDTTSNQTIGGDKTFSGTFIKSANIRAGTAGSDLAPITVAVTAGSSAIAIASGSATWRHLMGNESTPGYYIGGSSLSSFFWRAIYTDTAFPSNSFKSSANNAAQVPLAAVGAVSQTADLFRVTNSSLSKLAGFDANGNLAIGNIAPTAGVDISGGRGLNIRNNVDTVVSSFDANGYGFVDRMTFALAQGVNLATGTNLTKVPHLAGFAGTITKVLIQAQTNGASGGFTLDIKKNGTTIFTTAPTVGVSTTTVQTFTTFSSSSMAVGDAFTVDCTSVGTNVQSLNVTIFALVRNS